MIIPPYLNKDDKIGIVSPAGRVSKEHVDIAMEIITGWGLKPVLGEHVFNHHFQYGGTDGDRLSDFQKMINDPEIKAIFCSRGGYGSIRIIDQINFSPLLQKPKWIVGFSDITVFNSHLNNKLKIATIHGPMPNSFFKYSKDLSLNHLKSLLFGADLQYNIPHNPLNKKGHIKSELLGGNLNILHNLIGSSSDFHPEGKILFIEEVGEYLYNIDRMMWGLSRAGKLKNLGGLIVGQFTGSKDNPNPFGKNEYEIIAEHVSKYDYPVCFGFPSGHGQPNYPLVLGKTIDLEISDFGSCVRF